MEPNKDLFQRTFSRLKSSPELGKEILTMTEETRRPKKFILRRVIAIAAAMALLAALAMGANAATGGELFGKLVYTFTMDNGVVARVYQTDESGPISVEPKTGHYIAVDWDLTAGEEDPEKTPEKALEVTVEFDGDKQQTGMKIKGYKVTEAEDGSLTSESFEAEVDENGEVVTKEVEAEKFVYHEVKGEISGLPEE